MWISGATTKRLDAEHGDGINEMLARVENEKNAPISQIGDEARRRIVRLDRQSQQRGHRRSDQRWIAQHSKINEQYGPGKGIQQVMSDRDGDCRLADATDAHNRHKARCC